MIANQDASLLSVFASIGVRRSVAELEYLEQDAMLDGTTQSPLAVVMLIV